jgi:hypothetical protein
MKLRYLIALFLIAAIGLVVMIEQWRSSRQAQLDQAAAQQDQAVAEWPGIEENCAAAVAASDTMEQEFRATHSFVRWERFLPAKDEFDARMRTAGEAATHLYRENPVFASAVREALPDLRVGPNDRLNPCQPKLRRLLTSRFSKPRPK